MAGLAERMICRLCCGVDSFLKFFQINLDLRLSMTARGNRTTCREEMLMNKEATTHPVRIDQLFAGPGARADKWRNLVELADAWSQDSRNRAKFDAALADLSATEEFHAYPGSKLMTALRDHVAANDAQAAAS